MTSSRRDCLRVSLMAVGLLLLVGGVLLLVVGADALVADGARAAALAGVRLARGPAVLLTVAGGLLLLMALLGVGAAQLRNRCMAITFGCLCVLLGLLTVLTAAVALLVVGPEASSLESAMLDSLDGYGADGDVTRAWDLLQAGFHCCGVRNGLDWARNGSLETAVPVSCCRRLQNGTAAACQSAPTNANSFFSRGCLAAAHQLLTDEGWLLGGAAVALTVVFLASAATACCFAGRTRRSHFYESIPPQRDRHGAPVT